MGLDLTFYELENYDIEETHKKHNIKEIAYFSNSTAMLLVNWLYRNHSAEIINKFNESDHYIMIYTDDIEDIISNLETVLYAIHDLDGTKVYIKRKDIEQKHILALHYFPTKFTVSHWINSEEMFSDSYYDNLEYIYKRLCGIIYGTNLTPATYKKPKNRCFFYNISW